MKSAPRFYVPDARATGDLVALPSEEAAHLSRVLRVSAGDDVRVFDGRGHEWSAVVEAVGKGTASVRLGESVAARPESRVGITLAPAVLKGDGLDEVIRDATVLGVVAIRPVVSARSEGVRGSQAGAGRVERWRRVAISAAKQCGRAVVPTIEVPVPVVAQTFESAMHRVVCVEPTASVPAIDLREYERRHPGSPGAATIFVGPEGGWTDDEIATAANAGCELVTFGSRTLRADAMPLVALALFQYVWRDL